MSFYCFSCKSWDKKGTFMRRHMALQWDEVHEVIFCECGEIILCTDCGSRPAHRDGGNYCRRCAEKGGERCSFYTQIDHDLLRNTVGDELAAKILDECREPW